MRATFALTLGLPLLVACGSSSEEPPAEASSGDEQKPATLRGHMSANFNLALTARDGVIAGSLIQVREAAVQLAEQDYAVLLPPDWMPGVERMQAAARDLTGAEDLNAAAAHVAQLAKSCGDCHAEKGLDLGAGATPAVGFGQAENMHARMVRHQHAANGFWYGLSVPSDESWVSAAQMLLDAPMSPTDDSGEAVKTDLATRIDEVRGIARRAMEVSTPEDRAAVYGEFLATCAACHTGGA